MNAPHPGPGTLAGESPSSDTPSVTNAVGKGVHRTIGVASNPHDMVPFLVQLEALRRLRK